MGTIHVIQGESAAASLRTALAEAGRDDRVIGLLDDLAVGPLRGIDESPDVRAAFWQRVLGDRVPDWKDEVEGEFARLDAPAMDDGQVVTWHAHNVAEQLLLRRVAYRLRNVPQRLNEVRLSAADLDASQRASLARADEACGAGMFSPAQLLAKLAEAAPISVLRISRLALEWQEAKQTTAEIRYWARNTIKSGHYADLDALILAQLSDDWTPAPAVAAGVLAAADHGCLFIGDSILYWRCHELAAASRLELRHPSLANIHSNELRVARAAAHR